MKNLRNNNYRVLLVMNTVGFLVMVVINFLANYLPINNLDTGYISGLYSNLFTPAGFTFSIWGLIYLLLAFFAFYPLKGFLKKQHELSYVSRIGYLFFISCLFNSAWIFAWHYLQIGLSLIIMILLLITLLILYNKLYAVSQIETGESIVRIAFSIYTGWITIATVANVTVYLVAIDWGGFGLSDTFWMVIVTIIATVIFLSFMFKNRDAIYSMVALWAFLGIIVKRLTIKPVETIVIITVIICMLVLTAGIVKILLQNQKTQLSS